MPVVYICGGMPTLLLLDIMQIASWHHLPDATTQTSNSILTRTSNIIVTTTRFARDFTCQHRKCMFYFWLFSKSTWLCFLRPSYRSHWLLDIRSIPRFRRGCQGNSAWNSWYSRGTSSIGLESKFISQSIGDSYKLVWGHLYSCCDLSSLE